MAQDTAFESTWLGHLHTEPMACLLGSDLLLQERLTTKQIVPGPLLSLVKCFLPLYLSDIPQPLLVAVFLRAVLTFQPTSV